VLVPPIVKGMGVHVAASYIYFVISRDSAVFC
jgi:hypothetical protein